MRVSSRRSGSSSDRLESIGRCSSASAGRHWSRRRLRHRGRVGAPACPHPRGNVDTIRRMKRLIVILTLLCALPLSAQDYRARRERLAAKLGTGVLVLFAATEEEGQNATHGFRQDHDFYYLTGSSEPGAGLVVAAVNDKRPYTEILFLPAPNVSQERWTGPKLSATSPDVQRITGFDRVETLDRMRDELVRILPSPAATVYTDLSDDGTT